MSVGEQFSTPGLNTGYTFKLCIDCDDIPLEKKIKDQIPLILQPTVIINNARLQLNNEHSTKRWDQAGRIPVQHK